MRTYDLYLNAKKASVGLYVRQGAGLPDLDDAADWTFDGTATEASLPPQLFEQIESNGHAFRDMN